MTWEKKGGGNLRMKANEYGLARFDQFNAFLLILWSGGIGYVRPFFDGMPALSSVSWSRPLAKMLKRQKRGIRMTADSTSNLGNHVGLGLGAIRLGHPGGETQDLEQGFAAHVAQHDTKRESGDRRTKHHQHTHIDSHNGPLHQSFCSPIVRRVRTSVLDKRVFARIISVSL
jgi:hypothetical protein